MSFDKNDVKHGIDNVATHLKEAVDKIADATDDPARRFRKRRRKSRARPAMR